MKIKIKDKDYEVSPFTQRLQKLYSKRIQDYYLDVIRENKGVLKDEEYLNMLKNHFFDVKNGAYDFGSDNFYKFLNTKDEFAFFWWWNIMEPGQIVNLKDVKEWVENNQDEAVTIFKELRKDLDEASSHEDKKKETTNS